MSVRVQRASKRLSIEAGSGFQNRLGHFLDEQGNAIGTLDDVLSNVRRKRVITNARRRRGHGGRAARCRDADIFHRRRRL
jgi:hypothetical protein